MLSWAYSVSGCTGRSLLVHSFLDACSSSRRTEKKTLAVGDSFTRGFAVFWRGTISRTLLLLLCLILATLCMLPTEKLVSIVELPELAFLCQENSNLYYYFKIWVCLWLFHTWFCRLLTRHHLANAAASAHTLSCIGHTVHASNREASECCRVSSIGFSLPKELINFLALS